MTATALAYDPAFDTALDFFDDGDGFDGFPARRPELRLIEGGGLRSHPPCDRAPGPIGIGRDIPSAPLLGVTRHHHAGAWPGMGCWHLGNELLGCPDWRSERSCSAGACRSSGDSYGAIAADLGAIHPVAAGEQLRAANGGGELIVGQRLVVDEAVLAAAG